MNGKASTGASFEYVVEFCNSVILEISLVPKVVQEKRLVRESIVLGKVQGSLPYFSINGSIFLAL